MSRATKSDVLNTAGVAIIAVCVLLVGCGEGRGIGAQCESSTDCANELQCLNGTCTPACESNAQCGDGFVCSSGECDEVISEVGDRCLRELDCGRGQTCLIAETDPDGDGRLDASCQLQAPGGALGTQCRSDSNCRSSSCNIGLCTEVCGEQEDCGGAFACTNIPRLLADGTAPLFRGCFQEGGELQIPFELRFSHQREMLLIPGNARSVAITTATNDPSLAVGVGFLATPAGQTWYQTPNTIEEHLQNPLRYTPARLESTLLVPNRDDLSLVAGGYPIEIGTYFQNGDTALDVPTAQLTYKLHSGAVLDINVYILDLSAHPCQNDIGGAEISSLSAASHPGMIAFTSGLKEIFSVAGIEIGEIRYQDVLGHPELDILDVEDLPNLLPIADGKPGLNLFLVRSVEPGGIQVIGSGGPGAPRRPASKTAGVALSIDTMCYRDWATSARFVAHAFGLQMGLFRNREPDTGAGDPIADSSSGIENLMFFGEFGGTEISDGQATVLRNYPGLRQ